MDTVLSARRLVAGFAVLLLLIGTVAPALAACAGWLTSPSDRHACCAHLGDLASEQSVTDCCAMSEQSSAPADRDSQLVRPMRPAPAASPAVLADRSVEPRAAFHDRTPLQLGSPPRYVLLASFLI